MSTGAEFEAVKWLWSLLLVPLAWLWNRINVNQTELSNLKEKVAGMPTRAELREAIKDAMAPLQDTLGDLKDGLREHHKEEIDRYDRILRAIEERAQRREQ